MQTKEQLINEIEKSLSLLQEEHSISFDEILSILKKRQKAKEIPLSIFKNKSLSCLEAVVKYLKEDINLNYKEIAFLLNRNYDPIAVTYRKAKKKHPPPLNISSKQNIPLKIFANKELSILENLVSFLKEDLNLTYHEIAVLINRDDRTIWTVYNRSLKKRKKNE